MLPPGPAEPPVVQTARWLLRPISFLESCRRRYGDAFSVRFLGFHTPMVMLSDPEAIRALYTERRHDLPPGRTRRAAADHGLALGAAAGGPEHLARRKLMLPPFHGERMRAYEATVREVVAREVAGWPRGRGVRRAPADAGRHARGDPARGLRRHRPGARRAAARAAAQLLDATAVLRAAVRRAARAPARRPRTRSRKLRRAAAEIDALLLAEIAERARRAGGARTSSRCCSRRASRTASRWTTRRSATSSMTLLLAGPRDDRDRAGVDARAARPPPGGARPAQATAPTAHTCRAVDRRVAAAAAGRAAGGPAADVGARGRRRHAAGGHRRDAGDLARPHARRRLPGAVRVPPRALPRRRAPPGYAWVPFGGGVRRCLGAAFAEMEMRVALATMLSAVRLEAADAAPERVARRNVTFSPARGTRLVAWEA